MSDAIQPKRHAPKGPLKAKDPTAPTDHKAPRCKARSKTTQSPCKQPAIPGGTVCRYHGGAAPQVKAKAQERLLAIQFPAIARLAQLVEQVEYPSTAMAAVKDVLDRTMGKPVESLELSGNQDKPLVFTWLTSESE